MCSTVSEVCFVMTNDGLPASSWLSGGFTDGFCWKCIFCCAAESPLPFLHLAPLRECQWTCCKCCSGQYPSGARETSMVSQADELPKRKRHMCSWAVWQMGRHKALIKEPCCENSCGVFFPHSCLSELCEECRNMCRFTGVCCNWIRR